jgi:hypothetical protein
MKTYGPDTFYKNTKANFSSVEIPQTPPDFESESGSRYWYLPEGVIRASDHWGGVATCYWLLDHDSYVKKTHQKDETGAAAGFCPWTGFQENNDYYLLDFYRLHEAKDRSVYSPITHIAGLEVLKTRLADILAEEGITRVGDFEQMGTMGKNAGGLAKRGEEEIPYIKITGRKGRNKVRYWTVAQWINWHKSTIPIFSVSQGAVVE